MDQNLCWRNPKPTQNIFGKFLVIRKLRAKERRYTRTRCLLAIASNHTHASLNWNCNCNCKYPLPSLKPSTQRINHSPFRRPPNFLDSCYFFPLLKIGFFFFLWEFWASVSRIWVLLNQKMKRPSLSFDKSHAVATDDEANEKLKYQSLLKLFLERQKEYVSRKRKLQAAKQKRDLLLSEVRFLRVKRKSFFKSQAPDTDKAPLYTLEGGRNPSSTLDQLLLPNSCQKAEGGDHARARARACEVDVRCTKKIKKNLIRDKDEGKHNISLLARSGKLVIKKL